MPIKAPYHRRGGTLEALDVAEFGNPELGDGEVRVRLFMAGVNS